MGTVVVATLVGGSGPPPAEWRRKTTLQAKFGDFGQILRIEIPEGQGTAYIQYEDKRDAEDAVSEIDGQTICGRKVKVQIATGRDAGAFRKVDLETRVEETAR